MYAFLRSPKWLLGHVLAVAGVLVFVWAGFWQLDRLEERRTYNATFTERLSDEPRPLADVVAEVGTDAEDLAYRRVTVTGSYRTSEETLWSTRSYEGSPGHHLLTPLETADGSGVIVDRGWVPLELNAAPVAEALPPGDEVTVTGVLFPPEDDPRPAPEAAAGRLPFVRQPDLDLLQEQVGVPLAPVYVLAQEQDPAQAGALPRPGALPELSERNHLSYAVQWFIFAAIVVVGWPILIARTARDRSDGAPARRERVPARAGRT